MHSLETAMRGINTLLARCDEQYRQLQATTCALFDAIGKLGGFVELRNGVQDSPPFSDADAANRPTG